MRVELVEFLTRLLVEEGVYVIAKFLIEDTDNSYGEPYLIRRAEVTAQDYPFEISEGLDILKRFSRWYLSPGDIHLENIIRGRSLVQEPLTLLCRSNEEDGDREDDGGNINWD